MTPEQLKALIDADPEFFRPAGSDDVQPDGYVSTPHLFNLLTGVYGEIDNPSPAPSVPKPVTVSALAAAAPVTLTTVSDVVWIEIGKRVDAQDRVWLATTADVLLARRQMPQMEHDAVLALMTETISDPSWPAKVPALPRFSGDPFDLLSVVETAEGSGERVVKRVGLIDQALGRAVA